MNREDIIRMVREAHRELVTQDYPGHLGQLDFWTMRLLERFAALVAAAERAACAKVCEDEAAEFRFQKEGCRDARYDWKEDAAMECSLAIRSRGEVKP